MDAFNETYCVSGDFDTVLADLLLMSQTVARTLVKCRPASFSDSCVVFVSSLAVAVAGLAPPVLAVKTLIDLTRERRRLLEEEDGGEPSSERAERMRRWRRKASVFAAAILAYWLVIRTRASPSTTRRLKGLGLWRSWFRYVDFELVDGSGAGAGGRAGREEQKVVAISPHGLVPFPLALAAIERGAEEAWGTWRVVSASATRAMPGLAWLIRTVLDGVDASRAAVDEALAGGDSVGVAPGGIEEMFQGYPKPGWGKDEEAALLKSRKGFIRLAKKYDVPVVPVFCFGASKLMRRFDLPFAEALSKLLRASLVVVYGRLGLPVPFRAKLLYVMGSAIRPREGESVDEMHLRFCTELKRVFDEYKDDYGWERKSLRIV